MPVLMDENRRYRVFDKRINLVRTVLAVDFEAEEVVLENGGSGEVVDWQYVVLMESTMLQDRDGTEIWEMDRFEIPHSDGSLIATVNYSQGKFVVFDDNGQLIELDRAFADIGKVVGSVYDG